jgi:hypothetical protein
MMTLRIVRWRKQSPRVRYDKIVWIDVRKLDEYWQRDVAYYLARGQGRRYAQNYIYEAITKGDVLPMPHISLSADSKGVCVNFSDGRNRFIWVRDNGGRAMPVTIDKLQVALVRKLFGSRSRICKVKVDGYS